MALTWPNLLQFRFQPLLATRTNYVSEFRSLERHDLRWSKISAALLPPLKCLGRSTEEKHMNGQAPIPISVFANHCVVSQRSATTSSGSLPKKTKVDRLLMCWWAFTGLTHIIIEGYFVFSPEFFKDNTGNCLAEVWKEYSKADSRYAGRDAGVVTLEGLTAILEGPASLLAVHAIATGKSHSYILQFAISLGQLYGCAVYYITAILEGDNFSASAFYYYAYYIGANFSWIVIPLLISIRCWRKICAAFQVQGQTIKPKVR